MSLNEENSGSLKKSNSSLEYYSVETTKIDFSFKDINFKIKNKKKEKHILKNASGVAYSGRLLSILGASGAGKSSLLNILAGRLRSSKSKKITGEVMLNGSSDINVATYQKHTAYVMQDDLLFETLTPKETFLLSACLRLPNNMNKKEKIKRAENIIKALNLTKCANTCVGGKNKRGISGGELKRVNIGNELVINPELLFVDEPTSGLDSYTAYYTVLLLKELAHSGRTVIATIHQPSSEMFNMFDDLLLLSEGVVVYNGPAHLCVNVFNDLGYVCPQYSNPADFFMSTIQIKNADDFNKIETICDNYTEKLKALGYEKQLISTEPIHSYTEKRFKVGVFSQISILISMRSFKNYIRNPFTTYIRLIQILFFSLISGILFFDLGNTFREVNARVAALFFLLTNTTFSTLFSVIIIFPNERKLFLREYSNGMYSAISFFVAKILCEMPFNIILVLIYISISYWMIGLGPSVDQFFLCYLTLMLGSQIAYSLGMLLGTSFPNAELAVSLSPIVLMPLLLFSGFFINTEDMQPWIRWITYINYFRYLMDLLVYNEFSKNFVLEGCIGGLEKCPPQTGNDIIEFYSLGNINYWGWFFICVGFLLLFLFLTYVFLLIHTRGAISKPLNKEGLEETNETSEIMEV